VPLLYAQTVATYATYGADRRAAAAMPRRAARRTDLKGLHATDRRYRRLQPSGDRRETRQKRTFARAWLIVNCITEYLPLKVYEHFVHYQKRRFEKSASTSVRLAETSTLLERFGSTSWRFRYHQSSE
jgi:hypothetical protein